MQPGDRDLKRVWKAEQRAAARAAFPLPDAELKELFDFVHDEVTKHGCDDTRRLTQRWLTAATSPRPGACLVAGYGRLLRLRGGRKLVEPLGVEPVSSASASVPLVSRHRPPYHSGAPMIVRVPTQRIHDWATFHDVFAEVLGFPEFYGRNMNAWIDCMSYLDDPDAGMTRVQINRDDVLALHLENAKDFARRCPEQYAAVVECSAFVNWRRIDTGDRPLLALSFYE